MSDISRVCIPLGLQNKLIVQALKGHTGITETLSKLRVSWMSQQVAIIVNNCISCYRKIIRPPQDKVSQWNRELLSYPMKRVYIDTVGPPFPK